MTGQSESEFENRDSNLQEKGFLEIGKSENKNRKSSSKLKVDLVHSTKSVEKAKSKRSKSKHKSNEIEDRFLFCNIGYYIWLSKIQWAPLGGNIENHTKVTNEVTVDPDPELENLMNRVMPLLNDSKRWQKYNL